RAGAARRATSATARSRLAGCPSSRLRTRHRNVRATAEHGVTYCFYCIFLPRDRSPGRSASRNRVAASRRRDGTLPKSALPDPRTQSEGTDADRARGKTEPTPICFDRAPVHETRADRMTHDLTRYHRQMLLPGFGEDGQRRLAEAKVLVLGCGALGTVVADMLARAGVGRL